MKRCPECSRTFTDETLRFCLYDGKPLTSDAPPGPAAPPYTAPPTPYAAPPPSSAAPPTGYVPPPSGYASPAQYAAPQYASPPYGMPPPQKKSGWVWVAGLVALFLLMRVGTHLANPAKPSSPSGTRPADGAAPPPENSPSDSDVHDSLISAVRQADIAQVQALSQGDPAPLYTAYTGTALQKQIQSLQKIKDSGLTVEGHLLNQDFGTFTVSPDRSQAQVDVTETWSMTFYSAASHQPLRSAPSNVFMQTLFLKHGSSGWTIDDARDKPH